MKCFVSGARLAWSAPENGQCGEEENRAAQALLEGGVGLWTLTMRHEAAEVAANNAVPSWPLSLVKLESHVASA